MLYKRQIQEKFNINKSFSPRADLGFFIDHNLVPFENNATEFSNINSWWMAECSRLSYVKSEASIKQHLNEVGFPNTKFFTNNGIDAFVTWNDKSIIIAFTGTELDEGFSDILIDLQFWPTKWNKNKGYVHNGFKLGLSYIWPQILVFITPLLKNRKLWLTGHSLGGALATLAASLLKAAGCYTFGSPRVGSLKFIKGIETPIYRIAKNHDIVTRIPTPPIYHHAGNLYFICNNGNIKINPNWLSIFYDRLGGNEWKILFLIIKFIIFRQTLDFAVQYLHGHSPYNYSVYAWNNINLNTNKN